METPIVDFVKNYKEKNMTRLHMPGHKGQSFLGCEPYDITEIFGADALYEADGIIAKSEANATAIFGTGRTLYSTEGSSQCIRAMLYLAVNHWKTYAKAGERPMVVAARNVHKAFVYAAALLDFDVIWLCPEGNMDSICGCPISLDQLKDTLKGLEKPPAAVYVTSPDYLGGQQDIAGMAKVCHENGTILAVDNAHGAYLHFTEPKMHPIDLGADICCDSAHKTLPVLTGGAYLQINQNAPKDFMKNAKSAMALFGSTSPSYLIMSSLDLCNKYLAEAYRELLKNTCEQVQWLRSTLEKKGWYCEGTEPLKLTVRMPGTLKSAALTTESMTGLQMAQILRENQVECEFADPKCVVLMFTPENDKNVFCKIADIFGDNTCSYEDKKHLPSLRCAQKMSIREAIFAPHEEVSVADAKGRICGTPTVSCPPAIPIVVSGEVIDDEAIALFEHYGVETVDVVSDHY